MNKKALEMVISTIILIALGVIVLIAIVYAIMGGFSKFKSTTDSFLDTSQATAVRDACSLACQSKVKISYCCTEHEIDNKPIKCDDSRLEVDCPEIVCEEGFCDVQPNVCNQKFQTQGPCAVVLNWWEYDALTNACVPKSGSGCSVASAMRLRGRNACGSTCRGWCDGNT